MGSDQYARDLLARRDKTIAEARAHIAKLREALENALGPTAAWAGHYQLAYETDDLHPDHQKLLDEIQAALAATPSDCYAQIRAEVLEDVAGHFGNDPQQQWSGFLVALEVRDMKDKP